MNTEPFAKNYRGAPLSAEELVRRAVSAAGHNARTWHPRWTYVSLLFGLGHTSSVSLCKRLGFDPDEMLGTEPTQEVECIECGDLAEHESVKGGLRCLDCGHVQEGSS